MMAIVSRADFEEDEIRKINSFCALDILAAVAKKAYEKESSCSELKPLRLTEMLMAEKKRFRFDLNAKPRTHGRPRSSPIDIRALLPCLYQKRKREEDEDDHPSNFAAEAPNKKMRVTAPPPQFKPEYNKCGAEETEASKKKKKKMRLTVRLRPPVQVRPELPLEYKEKIAELGGSDIRFVMEKKLFASDVDKTKYRLLMPYKQCKVDFSQVGEMEVKVIHKLANNMLSEMVQTFRKWDSLGSYVFTKNSWNDLVEADGLKIDDVVQVWCFRRGINAELCFALVKIR